jgi:Mn-dependent DtxR family transcriptional regulator
VGANNGKKNTFTKLQGQYLAYIAMYTKLHRRPPAEADLHMFFGVTPPSVHHMILTLEKRGLIIRTQVGLARLKCLSRKTSCRRSIDGKARMLVSDCLVR